MRSLLKVASGLALSMNAYPFYGFIPRQYASCLVSEQLSAARWISRASAPYMVMQRNRAKPRLASKPACGIFGDRVSERIGPLRGHDGMPHVRQGTPRSGRPHSWSLVLFGSLAKLNAVQPGTTRSIRSAGARRCAMR